MIVSIKGKFASAVIEGRAAKGFPADILRTAERRMQAVANALMLDDLRSPPGNRLEALKGDRAGQHSIRIKDQWRICFRWTDAGAEDVEIVDYHWEANTMAIKFANPAHPGEFLREEYLLPLNMSAGALAKALHLPRTRIERIVKEQVGITPDTALRLAKFFNTTPEFWMNFQTAYELDIEAKAKKKVLDAIEQLAAA